MSYAKDGTLASCLFCNFANKSEKKELLHEDDLCVAFLPLDVSAVQHFMIVPKEHIATVSVLRLCHLLLCHVQLTAVLELR